MNELKTPKTQYSSIVLSSDSVAHHSADLLELPKIRSSARASIKDATKPKKSIKTSRSEVELLRQPSIKLKVFPDILKQTHRNIVNFRHYDTRRIDDELVSNFFEAKSTPKAKAVTSRAHFKSFRSEIPKQYEGSNTTLKSLLLPNQRMPAQSSMSDQTLKFHNISSDATEGYHIDSMNSLAFADRWRQDIKVNRLNKAYLIQQQYFKDRMDKIWKPDEIQKQLQQTIISQGTNPKKGLRQIFMLFYVADQTYNSQRQYNIWSQKRISIGEKTLKVIQYYIPVYKRIDDRQELLDDHNTWEQFLLTMLKMKSQKMRVFYLDGKPLNDLSTVSSYEKVFYMTLQVNHHLVSQNDFDFWQLFGKSLELHGQFNNQKYHNLVLRLYDLRTKEELLRYLAKRDNFLPFFEYVQPMPVPSKALEKILNPTTPQNEPNVDDELFESSIFHMNEQTQQAFINIVQQNLQKQKAKYSSSLHNLEEALRSRLENIKQERRKPLKVFKRNKEQKRVSSIKPGEVEHYERLLVHGEQESIADITEQAFDKVHPQEIIVKKKYKDAVDIVGDPFELLSRGENKKFSQILKFINIEKIMCDKFLSRQDVITYLSIFKSLMDSDMLPPIRTKAQQSLLYQSPTSPAEVPILYISLKQLRRALPYLALYKPTVNTKKLNEIFDRRYKYVGFMDFLDIFAFNPSEVGENEVLDNHAFI